MDELIEGRALDYLAYFIVSVFVLFYASIIAFFLYVRMSGREIIFTDKGWLGIELRKAKKRLSASSSIVNSKVCEDRLPKEYQFMCDLKWKVDS